MVNVHHEHHVLVPSGATPNVGASYYWQVRAVGTYPPSLWSTSARFIRVTSVLPPGAPLAQSPPDGATLPGSAALLEWGGGDGAATEYRLEVSTTADFSGNSSQTWVTESVPATSYLMNLPSGVTSAYWRVTGHNSAGYGPPSQVLHFTLSPDLTGVAGCSIESPAFDLTMEDGDPVQAIGLVVGRTQGNVIAEWLVDGETAATQSLTLNGTGVETGPFAVPELPVGTHLLQLRVTGTNQVESMPRAIEVDPTDTRPAQHLRLRAGRIRYRRG